MENTTIVRSFQVYFQQYLEIDKPPTFGNLLALVDEFKLDSIGNFMKKLHSRPIGTC